ncbi:disease resistance protein RPV1 [Lactuca sativa]|uniref:TIR domain-containing protein n=1 Tax=Lactuca sativa TaxID=4236 RepID=A0A9R1WGS9_LACSA|nr:disease resistance protein RPV1 [Lactuca sativa]KAJ0223518.1 hypothetical protein LSAT_V11C200056980 [Lactuca sativa]
MASSSTLFIQHSYKYDVFLSFSGEDTRKSFVDHLYVALQRQGIHTYKDDESLEKGKKINVELLKSIQDSKFYIIIFSKNYASSSWCLDELVKIMECQKNPEHIAYPVFYDVEPSEIRKQLGGVGKAFAKHKKKGELKKWKEVLEEASNLAGWDLRNTDDGHEAKLINKIVEKISVELRFSNLNVDEKLVGMESRINDIVSSLETGAEDVRIIGIKGIAGGGKTTLARAIFDKIHFQFEGKSFVENVREVAKASLSGLQSLQEQVLSNVLNDKRITVGSVHDAKSMMKKMLSGKKVLLILDDVDDLDQMDALAGGVNWLKSGSRIIITTRDEQVLVAYRVMWIHDVSLLSHKEAICLFSRYAFGRDIPIQRYNDLSLKVVHYAAGLPLTIRVLGSFLCGKDELEWKDALNRLKTIPLKETQEKLEISYTGLEDDYKEIFLDVACLLKGWLKDDAIRALESCGFHARNGLRVLEQKSLMTISPYQRLGMHDHIAEMGRNIVRRLHPDEPLRHSRLWIRREIEDVLANDLVMEATRALATNTFPQGGEKNLRSNNILTIGFENMKKLRFLYMVSETHDLFTKVEVGRNFPNALRFLCWQGYPHFCLPRTFQADNLVSLEMPYSRIERLWEEGDGKVLNNLKFLDFSYSKLTTLDCGLLPNLEKLKLEKCKHLVELHTPIGSLRRLVYLNLSHCHGLDYISFVKQLESLQVLQNLRFLDFSHSYLMILDCGLFPNLEKLNLGKCYYLVHPHTPVGCLRRLVYLNINHCRGFESLSFIKQLESLQVLDLSYLYLSKLPDILPGHYNYSLLELNFSRNDFEELPSSIGNLQNLVCLDLSWCKNLKSLPQSICSLQRLKDFNLESSTIKELPEDLGHIECLELLNLRSTPVKYLPNSICMLKHLKTLLLAYCKVLKKLPENIGLLESLEELSLAFCKIRDVPSSICKLTSLREFNLRYCDQLEKLPEKLGDLTCLKKLNVQGTGISHLPHGISSLKSLKIIGFGSEDSSIYNYVSRRKTNNPKQVPTTMHHRRF